MVDQAYYVQIVYVVLLCLVLLVIFRMCCCSFPNENRRDEDNRALFIRNHVVLKKVKQYFASSTEDDSGKETSVKFPIDSPQRISEESDIEAQLQLSNLEEDKNSKNRRECDGEECECESNFTIKSNNCDSVFEEQNGKQKILKKKCSILVRSSSQIDSNVFVPESECSPTMCSICYQEYEVGEDICWSRNETCTHAYHIQCITLWLMNHDDCPMCRGTYLVEE